MIDRTSFFFCEYDDKKGIVNTYSDEYFTEGSKQEKEMIANVKTQC